MSYCSWQGEEQYRDHWSPGIYVCNQCGYELFSSRSKFKHHSPWPAFTETIHPDSVSKHIDYEIRTAWKVRCGRCDQSLGHEFIKDSPDRQKSRF